MSELLLSVYILITVLPFHICCAAVVSCQHTKECHI